MEGTLTLIRGLPGSGKSTFASGLVVSGDMDLLVEADHYFMVGGEYIFDHAMLQEAHKWCLWATKTALKRGYNVVVANTFTRYWEMREYLRLRPNAVVYRCTGEYGNIHGVPVEAIGRMRDRFEDLQGELFV